MELAEPTTADPLAINAPGSPGRERLRKSMGHGILLSLLIILAIALWGRHTVFGGFSGGRINANETAAISTLRNLSSAQLQFMAAQHVDSGNVIDGAPGTFLELSGGEPVRGSNSPLEVAVLPGAFRTLDAVGDVRRSGYVFRIYLLGDDGEVTSDPTAKNVAPSSLRWCAYAWPIAAGYGDCVFVDDTGALLRTDNRRYVDGFEPAPHAAFLSGKPLTDDAEAAINQYGQDGNFWRSLN